MKHNPTKTELRTYSKSMAQRFAVLPAVLLALFLILGLAPIGCVYFNTFYNSKKNFNEAEKARIKSIEDGASRLLINRGKYQKAIEKASIILEKHGDSKYYDDALYVIGVSYFWLQDYLRSQRKFRELLANFEESEFVTMSRLYLAKCKLELDERPEAIKIFQRLLETVEDDKIKSEATFAIGDFYYEQSEYENAQPYYQRLLDSLAFSEDERRRALLRIAGGQYARFKIPESKANYLKILDMKPTESQEYTALFRAGECSYLLQDIPDGMERFSQLAEDERFFDSIGPVRLQIARGYEMDDDLILAIEEYETVSLEARRSWAGGSALYNLGLIYQYDYEDLDKALEYYNEAKKLARNLNPYYDESVKRAADIGKLATFGDRQSLDSGATEKQINEAALSQIQLGELYLIELDQPDSAIVAFEFTVDSLPGAYYTPRAMISLALAHRDHLDDTTTYDSLIQRVVDEYPRSDFYPDALRAQGLLGTVADTGYAAHYFERAEEFLLDDGDLDSALYFYQFVADSFANSNLAPKARFSIIWLNDQYRNSGEDSAIYFAYEELADLFPEDDYGLLAGQLIDYIPTIAPEEPEYDSTLDSLSDSVPLDSIDVAANQFSNQSGIDTSLSPELRYYISRTGGTLRDAPSGPSQDRVIDFIYPSTAGDMPDYFDLYYQVKIDFDGTVQEFELKNPTPHRELNEAVGEQVSNLIFNVGRFGAEGIGDGWFVYKRRITKPDYLR